MMNGTTIHAPEKNAHSVEERVHAAMRDWFKDHPRAPRISTLASMAVVTESQAEKFRATFAGSVKVPPATKRAAKASSPKAKRPTGAGPSFLSADLRTQLEARRARAQAELDAVDGILSLVANLDEG